MIENFSLTQFLLDSAIFVLFSSIVQALLPPDANSSKGYIFFYRFAHILGANWRQFREGKLNGSSPENHPVDN